MGDLWWRGTVAKTCAATTVLGDDGSLNTASWRRRNRLVMHHVMSQHQLDYGAFLLTERNLRRTCATHNRPQP